MKCKKCSNQAVIHLRAHNIGLCREHFVEFFEKRVQRAIDKFKMFTREDKVLVAVSSGKDSSAVLHALHRLGYNVEGLFLKMGRHTNAAERVVQKLAESTRIRVNIYDVTQHFGGLGTGEIAQIVKRPVCSICGIVRRHWMNRYAVENGFTVLVTGHNMDDEATFLFGNILNWQIEYMARQWPVLEKTHDKFVRKAKPLIYVSERETYAYVLLNDIPFMEQKCPFSKGATSSTYKKHLNAIEYEQPGAKHRLLFGYFDNLRNTLRAENTVELKECSVCGFPTTEEKCQYCKLVERVNEKLLESHKQGGKDA
ncbi:MAG: TIGR00269 family protein [Fervidobacterium sp.]|uniref:TIGR00269 family protein n=1 Tax=Fervidobacterium sp. TaxID=1871331 RepID=UPI00404B97F0